MTVIALITNYDQLRPEKKQQHLVWLSAWLLIVVAPILFATYQWSYVYYQKHYGVPALQTLYQLADPSKTDAQGKRVYNGEVQLTPSKQQYAIGEPLRFTVLSPSSQPGYLSVLAYSADNLTNGLSLLVSNEPIVAREQGAISLPTASMTAKGSANGGALLAQGLAGKVRLLAIVTPTSFDWQGRSASSITLPSSPVIADLFTCENRAEPNVGVRQCDAQRALAGYAPSKVIEVSIVNAAGTSAVAIPAPAAPSASPSQASTVKASLNTVIDGYEILDDPTLGKSSLARDPKTGLVWQRCSVGQSWTGSTCAGEAKKFTFEQAQQLTRDDWRVPTVRELHSIVVCSNGKTKDSDDPKDGGAAIKNRCDGNYIRPTINTVVFPKTHEIWYWMSSPYVGYSDSAWVVSFGSGNVRKLNRDNGFHVRLVRASQ